MTQRLTVWKFEGLGYGVTYFDSLELLEEVVSNHIKGRRKEVKSADCIHYVLDGNPHVGSARRIYVRTR
jgi:hypothetical protein